MSLQWNRTDYSKEYRKIVWITPYNSSAYPDLALKYGGDWVLQASSTSFAQTITEALGKLDSNANDAILIMPGTYVLAAGVTCTINKNVTIAGVGNRDSVIINADTNAAVAFTLTAAADYATIKNLTIDKDAANDAIIVPASCPGVVIDNVVILGDNSTTATTNVGIDGESANLVVRNCFIYGVPFAIQNSGHYATYENNTIRWNPTTTAAVGIDHESGDYPVIIKNDFSYCTTQARGVVIGSAAACTSPIVMDNNFYANGIMTTAIHAVSATTPMYLRNYHSSVTTQTLATIV